MPLIRENYWHEIIGTHQAPQWIRFDDDIIADLKTIALHKGR
jgi:hypothetical protein